MRVAWAGVCNSMNPVNHTYDTGSYEACVYAYTACGNDMHCSRVTNTNSESISTIQELGVSVYPNPAKDETIDEMTDRQPIILYFLGC